MRNSTASSVAPLPTAEARGDDLSPGLEMVRPRDFRFAVTWIGLFAHLHLVKSTGPRVRTAAPSPAPLALVPVVSSPSIVPVVVTMPAVSAETSLVPSQVPPPLELLADAEPAAAWEMVVPKMIRTGARTFVPADDPGSANP